MTGIGFLPSVWMEGEHLYGVHFGWAYKLIMDMVSCALEAETSHNVNSFFVNVAVSFGI